MFTILLSQALPLSSFYRPPPSTPIYTLSLHGALPISSQIPFIKDQVQRGVNVICLSPNSPDALNQVCDDARARGIKVITRSEEHTSELQSRGHLVCRLLLEKKKTTTDNIPTQLLVTSI